MTDVDNLRGFSYTYVGSRPGEIANAMIQTKCCNPIIFFDELDKIGQTTKGQEISHYLTHLIDPVQNSSLEDSYFDGVHMDLSKVLFVFSYNNAGLIDPILMDRITNINFDHYRALEKIVIANKYSVPRLQEKYKRPEFKFSDQMLRYVRDNYVPNVGGVRDFNKILDLLVKEFNIRCIEDSPPVLDEQFVDNTLTLRRKRHEKQVILPIPTVGRIQGMYATQNHEGGILPIHCMEYVSDREGGNRNFHTGNSGDVMSESYKVALSTAFSLVEHMVQHMVPNESKDKKGLSKVLHLHFEEVAVPKDGPSAGLAMTLCIVSRLLKRPILNNLGVTGEINVSCEVTAIGGLEDKLYGSLRSGADKFIAPMENRRDVADFVQFEIIQESKVSDKEYWFELQDKETKKPFNLYMVSDFYTAVPHAFADGNDVMELLTMSSSS